MHWIFGCLVLACANALKCEPEWPDDTKSSAWIQANYEFPEDSETVWWGSPLIPEVDAFDAYRMCRHIGGIMASPYNNVRNDRLNEFLQDKVWKNTAVTGAWLGATFGSTPEDFFSGSGSYSPSWFWDDGQTMSFNNCEGSDCGNSNSNLRIDYDGKWESVGSYSPIGLIPICEVRCTKSEPNFDIDHFYEVRGVWVATVAQIDYPATLGTNLASEHKQQLRNIVQQSKALGLNTIYFHVRPNSDAFYKSDLECWSYWLTGAEGTAPVDPDEDPLRWILEFAQEFSMQVHAWINPYRASSNSVKSGPCENNMMRRFPEAAFDYPPNSGSFYMDPGSRDVMAHIVATVTDMLEKYGPNGSELSCEWGPCGLSGVHMDDYFYPYPSTDPATGQAYPIPDDDTYAMYAEPGQSRDDFRRENVNSVVAQLQQACHEKNVQFGVSPFGIYKSNEPPKIKGMSAPDEIYADAVAWLQRGTVDYLAPQLYWQDIPQDQSFSTLVNYWAKNTTANPKQIPIIPGLATYRTVDYNICPQQPWSIGEINAQIEICREFDNCLGHIHFSQKYLLPENKYHTSCSSLQRDTIDFDDHASFSELFSPYLGLKQGPYNFHRAEALPGFAEFFDADLSSTSANYASGDIRITTNLVPDAIAIYSDYVKLLYVANVSTNPDYKMTTCRRIDTITFYCDLSNLLPWIPDSEAAKIDWKVSLIFKSQGTWSSTNLISA